MKATTVNKAVGNRRLLKLAEFLKKLPKKRFDYSDWAGEDWKGAKDLSCGTTACALGWATAMPEFQRLGLRLVRGQWGIYVALGQSSNDDSLNNAAKISALDWYEAAFLFEPNERLGRKKSPGYKATPQQVAAHIETFVKERQKATK